MLVLRLGAMKIVQVALPSPLRRCFDYLLPAAMNMPAPGCRVRVPFGRREVVGLVVGEAANTGKVEADSRHHRSNTTIAGCIMAISQVVSTVLSAPTG